MNIKTPSIATLLFLSTATLFAQKCEVKEDPISGERLLQFSNVYKTLRFENKGTELTDFYTTFSYGGEHNTRIDKGAEIFFKLKNGEILKLTSLKEASPKTQLVGQSIITNYTFAFQLSKEEIQTLASDKITFVRYPSTDGGTLDLDVKGLGKIYINKITKGAKCFAENLK